MRAASGYVVNGEWHEREDRCDQCDCSDCCESECVAVAGVAPARLARTSPTGGAACSPDDDGGDPWATSCGRDDLIVQQK
jgi:hypothetical protein